MRHPTVPAALAAVILAAALAAPPAAAQTDVDEQTARLLVDAVTAAVELDLYNARCRSERSGRHADTLNRILASRFRTTLVKVQDTLFPERSYRAVQQRLQDEFAERLRQAGGCKEAKDAGMREELSDRYRKLMGEIEGLP